MSVVFCVIFKEEVPPHGTCGAENITLAKQFDEIEAFAESKGLRTLGSFVSQDSQEIADELGVDLQGLEVAPEEWFIADDAITAVQSLINQIRSNSKAILKSNELLEELEQVKTELTAASIAKVKFHFSFVM